jgi:SAM-dependent methyltransferase
MAGSIANYRNMVEQPWGKMFYEQIFTQLRLPEDKRLKILDFGAGFCITSEHYAKFHDVTAVEPNEEMYSVRFEGDYTLITKGIEFLSEIADNTYDVVICHNVLEYVDDKDAILKELGRVLKSGGKLSVIKHNIYGRALASAVFGDDPKASLDLLNGGSEDSMFGNRDVYPNEYLTGFFSGEMKLENVYGIRAFFGLSKNNEIKYTEDWYNSMLELENKASSMDEYKRIAFFNHLILTKN